MGWTSYHANYYKNGTIDRKAECDSYWTEGLNKGNFKVVASSMVGSVYYGAIQPLHKVEKDSNGNKVRVPVPENEKEIFGVVFLTSTNMKDYDNFSYKEMSESMIPAFYDCPKKVLDALTPTNDEDALAWRNLCRENMVNKKLKPTLANISVGTIIEYKDCNGKIRRLEKMAPAYQFKTPWFYEAASNCYITKKYIPSDFKIVGHR